MSRRHFELDLSNYFIHESTLDRFDVFLTAEYFVDCVNSDLNEK